MSDPAFYIRNIATGTVAKGAAGYAISYSYLSGASRWIKRQPEPGQWEVVRRHTDGGWCPVGEDR